MTVHDRTRLIDRPIFIPILTSIILNMSEHKPVLLQETIDALDIKSDGLYIDCTFGRGGHSNEILARLGSKGTLLVIDQDPEAVIQARKLSEKDSRVIVAHANFSELITVTKEKGISNVDSILFDLGVSSPQLDVAERGFSFSHDGPLDMRMNNSENTKDIISAAEWINHSEEQEIADVLWTYGEERYSRKIAKAIVNSRKQSPILRTQQLAEIIKTAHPNWPKNKHPATKSFMAIRLYINKELEVLQQALEHAVSLLKPEGKLVVISFHSLEDRIVKMFMANNSKRYSQSKTSSILSKLPIMEDSDIYSKHANEIKLKNVQKPIKAGIMELEDNIRARSAILRIATKV